MIGNPFDHATAAERMEATLTAMGAGGYRRDLDHAQVVYGPHTGRLFVALDYYAWDEATDEPADLTPTWLAICRLVKAGGYSGELEVPGDREIGLYPQGDSVLGREWKMTRVMSWAVDVPGAPWVPEEGDVYMVPESREVAAHALAMDPYFNAVVNDIKAQRDSGRDR
jgi:hypothetical protein